MTRLPELFAAAQGAKLKIAVFILLLIFYGTLLAHEIKLPAADDLGRHIKNGEMLLKGEFSVLDFNVYSYTEPEAQFANHHWLFGVFAYMLDETVGFEGMVIAKITIFLGAFSLIFFLALRKADFWLVAFFSIPTILILMERTSFRPEAISYLFIATYLYLLFDSEGSPGRSRVFWLVPLQVLWVNTHIFFVIGIALAGGFLFERIVFNIRSFWKNTLVRKLGLLTLLLALASLLNPHGLKGALLSFPLNIKGGSPIDIAEDVPLFEYLQGMYYWADVSVALYVPLIVLLAASFFFGLRNRPVFYAMASVATATLGFLHLRAFALFALIFLPAVTANLQVPYARLSEFVRRNLGRIRAYLQGALILGLVTLLFALVVFHEQFGIQRYRHFGIGLVRWANDGGTFFREHGLKGPIFNDADVGSYLIYHVYPEERVFVDNRFGDAYSPSFLNEYLSMVADESLWKEKSRLYGFNTIFFYQYDQVTGGRSFLSRRMHDPEWAFVYADVYNLIFIRNVSQNQALIERFGITPQNASERLAHLLGSDEAVDRVAGADILFLLGEVDLAMTHYIDIVTRWPDEDSVWMVMGEVELQQNNPKSSMLAVTYLKQALGLGRETAEVYSFLGLAYLRLDQFAKGKAMLERALQINPERRDAKSFLEQLDARLQREGITLDQN